MSTIDTRLLELRELETKLAERQAHILNQGDGGGTSGGMSDDWKRAVDDQLKRNADDLRALLRGTVTAGLVVISMILGLYVYIGNKTDVLGAQIVASRSDTTQLRGEVGSMGVGINGKLDRLGDRLPR